MLEPYHIADDSIQITEASGDVQYPDNLKHLFSASKKPKPVIIFVHGYNTSRSEARTLFGSMVELIRRDHRQIANTDADYICMTWNSYRNDSWNAWITGFPLRGYVEDLDRIFESSRRISWFINDIANSGRKVYLIGHSMGCQAIVQYIAQATHNFEVFTGPYFGSDSKTGKEKSRKIVTNIVGVFLIAPDVQVALLRAIVQHQLRVFWTNGDFKLIIFGNPRDVAIRASKLLRYSNRRIGDVDDALDVLNNPLVNAGNAIEVIQVITNWISLGHNYCTDPRVILRIKFAIFNNRLTNVEPAHGPANGELHRIRDFNPRIH